MKIGMCIATTILLIMSLSCGSPKKETPKSTEPVQTNEPTPAATEEKTTREAPATASRGAKLYEEKGCLVCHQIDSKLVGPSIKDIAAAYKGDKAGLTAFLKGEGKAIVDPSQASVMQPQIAITQAMPAEDLNDVVDYILSFN